jgi:hypothetical protein
MFYKYVYVHKSLTLKKINENVQHSSYFDISKQRKSFSLNCMAQFYVKE